MAQFATLASPRAARSETGSPRWKPRGTVNAAPVLTLWFSSANGFINSAALQPISSPAPARRDTHETIFNCGNPVIRIS
jgi:hypothetical protein